MIWLIYLCQLCVILTKMQISESCRQQLSESGLTTSFVAVYLQAIKKEINIEVGITV